MDREHWAHLVSIDWHALFLSDKVKLINEEEDWPADLNGLYRAELLGIKAWCTKEEFENLTRMPKKDLLNLLEKEVLELLKDPSYDLRAD